MGVPPTAFAVLALGITAALTRHPTVRKAAAWAAGGLAAGAIGKAIVDKARKKAA